MIMNAKKKVDRTHKNYPEYIEKCKKLSEKFLAMEQEAEGKYPEWRGLDHPAGEEIQRLKKQLYVELKALQEKYAHLFYDEVDG